MQLFWGWFFAHLALGGFVPTFLVLALVDALHGALFLAIGHLVASLITVQFLAYSAEEGSEVAEEVLRRLKGRQ